MCLGLITGVNIKIDNGGRIDNGVGLIMRVNIRIDNRGKY
jgi:hypothetical protein